MNGELQTHVPGKGNALLMTEPVFSLCVCLCKLLYFSRMLLNPIIGHVCELASP